MADTIIPFINDFATTDQAGATPEFVGITENPSEGVINIPIVYGFRRIEGVRLWTYVPTGNTTLLYCVYALSEGYCRGIQKLYIDDVPIDIDYTQVVHRTPIQIGTGQYGGILEIEFVDGRGLSLYGSAGTTGVGPSTLILRDTTISKQYANLTYLVCKFTYSTPTPYRNIPKVSVDLLGRRLANLSSGTLGGTYSTNPIEILWDLLRDSTYGAGVGYDKIDYTNWNAARNSCNTLLSSRGGTNIKQFECNWICDTSANLLENIQYLLDSFKITLSLIQGKYVVSLESNPSDSDTPSGGLTFNESNIVSDISIQYPNLSNKFNRVVVDYPDRDGNFQTRSQVWPATSNNPYLVEDGNVLLEQRFSADTVNNYWHASDMAQMILLRSRTQKIYRFTADKTAHRVRVGDYIFINTTYPLIVNEKVIVVALEMNDDYTFNLECVTYLATNYPAAFTNVPPVPQGGNSQPPGGGGVVTPAPLPNPDPTPPPTPTVTYTLAANGSTFNEGSTITFSLTTTNVTNGTIVRWTLEGPTNSDISPSALSGSLTITSNAASYAVTALSDAVTEGPETWTFNIVDSTNGARLATTSVVVQDTSLAPPPPTYLYTFAGAPFMDTVNANNQRIANSDWYMAFTNSANAYDSTETATNGNQVTWTGTNPAVNGNYSNALVRQRITKTILNPSTGAAYSTIDTDICLIDRLYVNRDKQRLIFCVYENFKTLNAGIPTIPYQNYRALNSEIIQFELNALTTSAYTGTNLLKVKRKQHTLYGNATLNGWERIDNTSTTSPQTNDLPGLVRLLPVAGKPGHYATNLASTSGRYTIKTSISVGVNSNPQSSGTTATNGRNCYLSPFLADNTSTWTSSMTNLLRLHFFELVPTTQLIVPLGFKIIALGLNRGCLTSKYYDESRNNLTSTIGSTYANPMPV